MADPLLKPEFPGLFPGGFHKKTVHEVRQLCVRNFGTSITRRGIMDGLERIVKKLNAADVLGELWVDGSFATEKIDPSDVDVILRVGSDTYDGDATVREAVDWAADPDRWKTHSCDAYKWIEYQRGHPLYLQSEEDRIYWTEWYGGHLGGRLIKGIIVVDLPADLT